MKEAAEGLLGTVYPYPINSSLSNPNEPTDVVKFGMYLNPWTSEEVDIMSNPSLCLLVARKGFQ